MNLGKTISRTLTKTAWHASFMLPAVFSTSLIAAVANDKLQAILDRAPFGPLPPTKPSEAERAAALVQADDEEDTRPRLSESVRLSAMTRFNGVPAAGLIDLTSGRSFFLIEGQTLGGFKLEEVSFENSSVILTKDNQTEPIYLAFAAGQPTNLVTRTNGNTLSVLNQQAQTPLASPNPTQEAPDEPPLTSGQRADHSPDLIAAATIIEPDGSARISFRELHRLRVEESREKAEREKAERETRAKLEREQREKKAEEETKAAEIAEQAETAAENLRRKQTIQAIKAGYDVELNFELTPAEAKELAEAGFDIPVEDPIVNEQEEHATD